ncbi:DNA primase [Plectonema cf. radiosum LEGE 06105]|uniref:DNA primase n=1 Tax=Plectonema cf. radiosum LEGE 06105 TaxID=945769 RepID=A0A8J7JT44_9CYAN|nr:DNA primase [Plectonema radiosum]MBE9213284.1 DNA primase [Plectonema cf. radiosum LEGE 06105]
MQIPRLHQDTIEEVKQRADIVDVISERVVLRKRGKDFLGLCPFHNEKTPSFSVSPSKQMYFCFGCQAGGNVIKFMMELDKRSFAEVVLDLARRYQVPVQTLEPEQRQELQRQISERKQIYEVLEVASRFYQHALWQPSGEVALEYLQQQRKLTDETIKKFELGYAPVGWDILYRYLVEDKRYPVQLLDKAGLIKSRAEGRGYYDAFRNRLMIPIHDITGKVIAFGGRTLGDEQPKYLNSPETEVFHKGRTLFGLDKAKSGISQFDQAVVVEGYFDVIALHAVGINNVVASLGTALSIEQVRLAMRYSDSKQLILNFDADKAGTLAAERAIGEVADLAYKGEVQLKILNIPDGKDADEYLFSHTSEDYQQLLVNAPLWLDWQIEQITTNCDLKQATDFQKVCQQMVKLLKNIDNTDTRDYYVSRCAEILSLGDTRLTPLRIENLLTQISPHHKQGGGSYKNKSYTPPSSNRELKDNSGNALKPIPKEYSLLEEAEGLLLLIYLHSPEYRKTIIESLEARDLQFSLSHHRFLWQQIVEIQSGDISNPNYSKELISTLQDRYSEFPEEMELVSHLFHLNETAQQQIIRTPLQILRATLSMEKGLREKRFRHFYELWEQTNPETEPQQYQSYYQAFMAEKKRLKELDQQRCFSIGES